MKNENTDGFPLISEAIIRELNLRFPEKTPDLGWAQERVWHASGQRSVVRLLNKIYEEQQDSLLGGK